MNPILQLGNPILRKQSLKVEDISSDEIQHIVNQLVETLASVGGVGIAAPQLGYLYQIFIIRPKPTKVHPYLIDNGPIVMINPEITTIDLEKIVDWEGCLSIPKAHLESMIYGKVERYKNIGVSYYDQGGIHHSETFTDFIARIIQHENDHLHGKLFIDTVDISSLCSYDEYQKILAA